MGLLLCLRRELPADWQKWDSMFSLCFPAEAGFSCRTEKIPSLLLREGLEITPKGRGEEKGIRKASLKLPVSGKSSPPLGLAFWQCWVSAGTAGHRQQQSTQKLQCLTQFLYSWEIHLLSKISLTLATPGISWGQHFPWSFGIWVPSGARKCRIMWSFKNRNALRRQLLLAASSCSLLLFHHLFPTGPKSCGSREQGLSGGCFSKGARVRGTYFKNCFKTLQIHSLSCLWLIYRSPKTPKPPKQSFLSPNWREKISTTLRSNSPKQGHIFHDVCTTNSALLAAGEENE